MKPLNTFYDTLQVPRSASDSSVLAAYTSLCQKYHPDNSPEDGEGAAKEMLLLEEAYATLSDSEKRFTYDLWITTREREIRAQEERVAAEAAAKASRSMFPPIEIPPDLPELLPTATPTAAPPRPVPTAPKPAPQDFAATTFEDPSGQSEFAETQPYMPEEVSPPVQGGQPGAASASTTASASAQFCAVREPPRVSPAMQAVDWLRERPLWLISVVLAAVLVIAFAPWLWRVSFGRTQPTAPITPDLQPTYVEPAADPMPALPQALEVPEAPAQESSAVGAESAERTAKPARAAPKKRPAAAVKNTHVVEAPVAHQEPAPAAPPLDAGGHSGFAPKCRWVTPTKWSCE